MVTALVPSETACLASSPGRMRQTEVWISREVMVDFLLYRASLAASPASFSKQSLMNEFMMDIALEEIPMSGWTCLSTLKMYSLYISTLLFVYFLPFFSPSLLADLLAGSLFSGLGFFPTRAFSAFSVVVSSSAIFFSALDAIWISCVGFLTILGEMMECNGSFGDLDLLDEEEGRVGVRLYKGGEVGRDWWEVRATDQ